VSKLDFSLEKSESFSDFQIIGNFVISVSLGKIFVFEIFMLSFEERIIKDCIKERNF